MDALTEKDFEVLIGMVQGRINAVKQNKGLDGGERNQLVNQYETTLHHLMIVQREKGWGRWAEDEPMPEITEEQAEAHR